MKKAFIARILRERIVDTRKYRYAVIGATIQRLPISALDTTRALNGWEVICYVRY